MEAVEPHPRELETGIVGRAFLGGPVQRPLDASNYQPDLCLPRIFFLSEAEPQKALSGELAERPEIRLNSLLPRSGVGDRHVDPALGWRVNIDALEWARW